jgi:hypothetical protein
VPALARAVKARYPRSEPPASADHRTTEPHRTHKIQERHRRDREGRGSTAASTCGHVPGQKTTTSMRDAL